MDDEQPFAAGGEEGETEAVNEPHRGGDAPTGSRVQPAAWLLPLGIVLLLLLGFLVGWGFGMRDVG
jgi:uncharacterized spore protein YtfJ